MYDRGMLPSYDLLPPGLLEQVRPLFVSRMPTRKISGAAHLDTIKGKAAHEEGILVKRVPLQNLRLKDGEIENYYRPEDDPALYQALVQRLEAHHGNANAAFSTPICKPGTASPVRKVKVQEKATLSVPVHGGKGQAANGGMVRIDIYRVAEDGYYLVPIYVADTVKAELPCRACVAKKPYEEWKPMKKEDFQFSLYPNDLILITDRKQMELTRNTSGGKEESNRLPVKRHAYEQELLYYSTCNISKGNVEGRTHDNAYLFDKGIKTLKCIEKYQVDMLGRTSRVGKEVRQKFR